MYATLFLPGTFYMILRYFKIFILFFYRSFIMLSLGMVVSSIVRVFIT
ncbi:MAG: hypothetical protein BSOLF_2130 [Candidatus Carbobacillus altaicus]|uniref:Uncharacterized protein n=1 Tax=Candidatus Carbonibacillus altaicus TaxID=2163959 RepID=A0A2R6XYB3_9BACL|nr:MAG: hypothetical protein BSOLF_2130 [Candidatus Carbobacillus altaicus]